MHIMVLDEFGHDGMYYSRGDAKYSSSPVFGYGGFVIPSQNTFRFISEFLEIKKMHHTCNKLRPYSEIKGAGIFQVDSFSENQISSRKYNTKRFFDRVGQSLLDCEGKFVYFGIEKYIKIKDQHNSSSMHIKMLKNCLKIAERNAELSNKRFTMFIDDHSLHKKRQQAVADAIFETHLSKWWLAEPPFAGTSAFSHLVQAADWICTILNRIWTYQVCSDEWPELVGYYEKFRPLIEENLIEGCRLVRSKNI